MTHMVTTAAPRARDDRPEPSLSDALLEVETHDADRLPGRLCGRRRSAELVVTVLQRCSRLKLSIASARSLFGFSPTGAPRSIVTAAIPFDVNPHSEIAR